MANYLKDNEDLLYYVNHEINWEELVDVTERRFAGHGTDAFATTEEAVEFYTQIMEMMGEFVADKVAPIAADLDREGLELVDGEVVFPPKLQSIFDQIRDLELHGMCLPR